MADNVITFPGSTTLDIDPDLILKNAMGQLDRVVVIGVHKDGSEYIAASCADGGVFMWDIERAKLNILRRAD